jgi:hypothetical protein
MPGPRCTPNRTWGGYFATWKAWQCLQASSLYEADKSFQRFERISWRFPQLEGHLRWFIVSRQSSDTKRDDILSTEIRWPIRRPWLTLEAFQEIPGTSCRQRTAMPLGTLSFAESCSQISPNLQTSSGGGPSGQQMSSSSVLSWPSLIIS